MQLILRKGRILRLRLFKINLGFLRRSSTSLIISLTGGLKEETKFMKCVLGTEMLSSKSRPVLSKGDF